ncbi:MAG: acyl-CoA dehydrogenase [Gammaproteobacteria bacterium]|nr:acyl-CoA dehydrogenase [Gammaproteobacteria bacterium]
MAFFDRRNLDFILYELLGVETLCGHPRHAGQDRAMFDGVLDTAVRIATEHFLPHAAQVDATEPEYDGTRVHILPQVKAALDAYREAGFMAAAFDADVGGLQLPWTIAQACGAVFAAANIGTYGYPLLTVAAANLLRAFGSAEQQAAFLGPMLEGRYFGTMCLSEPQAGSSLADIRTRAQPAAEGHYLVRGSKMWISGGEHDLAENIVHMVLARIPGAPAGVKGISLFLVPKYLPGVNGAPGVRNDVALAGLNHKMGYRATVNTLLNFGEQGRCIGYLVGEPQRGLEYMFQMMNEARIGVGLGATMCGYAGYLSALEYARGRPQGRLPENKDPTAPQVLIIEHADVRRLLLAQKAAVEGALALVLYCAHLVDRRRTAADAAERERLGLLLDILTPIAKSWPSEFCLEANKHAIQVLGGYGYTRDYPVERLYRDNRLNAIHEGTHGIQGIDLLGRKVTMRGGAALHLLLSEIEATLAEGRGHAALDEHVASLAGACARVREVTAALSLLPGEGRLGLMLANATVYLDMLGHVVIAWTWLRQALVAERALAAAGEQHDFYIGKQRACRYFFRYELPRVQPWLDLLARFDDTCLTMSVAAF